ncbi:hypothetical protein VPH35_071041 [Triticum aestivum]
MQEELVEVKKKSEETEAVRAAEYQLLLQRVEATDARAAASDSRFARLMDLFEGKLVTTTWSMLALGLLMLSCLDLGLMSFFGCVTGYVILVGASYELVV